MRKNLEKNITYGFQSLPKLSSLFNHTDFYSFPFYKYTTPTRYYSYNSKFREKKITYGFKRLPKLSLFLITRTYIPLPFINIPHGTTSITLELYSKLKIIKQKNKSKTMNLH